MADEPIGDEYAALPHSSARATFDDELVPLAQLNEAIAGVNETISDFKNEVQEEIDGALSSLSSNPVGTVIHFAGATAPSEYLVCDGTAVSRTQYASLFTAIGTLYGVGDGSTTFNLPNFQGRFLRGSGGNAAAIGTAQGDAIRNITGTGVASGPYPGTPSGALYQLRGQQSAQGGNYVQAILGFDASRVVPTDIENRPVNYAVLLCIKF